MMMNTYNITFYKLCQKSLPHCVVQDEGSKERGKKESSLLDILYTFGLDLGSSWIVFGWTTWLYDALRLYVWHVCTYIVHITIYIQSCVWHTMSSKRSPPTVNESTPEAAAAAPTVDLHGVLVIQSKRKKSTEWCGFAYGIIDDRNDLNFDGCIRGKLQQLRTNGGLPSLSSMLRWACKISNSILGQQLGICYAIPKVASNNLALF